MTDDEIKNLRRTCANAPPRVDGRQVILDPRTVTALLDEVERLRAEVAAKQRGYDDLHQMISGQGDIWSKVDALCSKVERMRETLEWLDRVRGGGLGHAAHDRIRDVLAAVLATEPR